MYTKQKPAKKLIIINYIKKVCMCIKESCNNYNIYNLNDTKKIFCANVGLQKKKQKLYL